MIQLALRSSIHADPLVRIGQVGQDRRQRDRGDHELEAGQEDADPDDGEEHVRRAAVHVGECSLAGVGLSPGLPTDTAVRPLAAGGATAGGGATTSEIVEGAAAATPIAAAAGTCSEGRTIATSMTGQAS